MVATVISIWRDTGGVWSDLRADSALRGLDALAGAGCDVGELHAEALLLISRVVPFDAACIGAVDPDTMLLTSGVTVGFDPGPAESQRFVEIEYGGLDPNSFSMLAARNVAVLADATSAAGGRSPARRRDLRFNELNRLLGFAHDVRVAAAVDGSCWAVGDLYRGGSSAAFDTREVQFIERASVLLARGTRAVAGRPNPATEPGAGGPAVLVVSPDGQASAMTPAAQEWFDSGDAGDGSPLWWAIRSAVTTAQRGAPAAYSRVRVGERWVVVRASPLGSPGRPAGVAVTIDAAAQRDLTDVLMAAFGLSPRERDVCVEVLAGRSTREIAGQLFVSPHTVQDHLKSIFDKTGMRSRRELMAALGG